MLITPWLDRHIVKIPQGVTFKPGIRSYEEINVLLGVGGHINGWGEKFENIFIA
jgi:hypothetical protein